MKNLIILLFLIGSASAFAYEVETKNYSAKFHKRIKEDRKKHKACAFRVNKYDEVTSINVEAVGTGRWVSIGIPNDKLPLQEGDSFIIESITVDTKVTYKNGILSVDYIDVEDLKFYYTDLIKVKIAKDLTDVELVEARKVIYGKSFFGTTKAVDFLKLNCKF